ncbi:hypothetical protein PG985_003798 [Apiospora marii]|uniref:uncharacterized protein n=1 Tax=Apiospora marii TaxID=335849 RepID=UPI00312D4303
MKQTAIRPSGGVWKNAVQPWTQEIALCLISSSLLAAIATTMAYVNGVSQEEWRFRITLNSLINILSTLFRACLATTAAEVISQQKWIWFWSAPPAGRPILQIRSFEWASRGPWGALKLLPGRAIGTAYRDMPLGLGTASLARSNSVNASTAYYQTMGNPNCGIWSFNPGNQSIMLNAIANPGSKDSVVSAACPTGNCTFPVLWPTQGITHTSIGVCSACTDVGPLVRNSTQRAAMWNGSTTYNLPNGQKVVLGDGATWLSVFSGPAHVLAGDLSWAERIMDSETRTLSTWVLVNTTVLTMRNFTGPDGNNSYTPVAVSCSLYPCVRSYAASVREGALSEAVVDSTPLVPDITVGYDPTALDQITVATELEVAGPHNKSLAAIQPVCQVNGRTYSLVNTEQAPGAHAVRLYSAEGWPNYPTQMANEGCITRMESWAYVLMRGTYINFMNGTCAHGFKSGIDIDCGNLWWLAQFWEQMDATVPKITDRFAAIAGATTNQIRLGFLRSPGTTDRVDGTALRQVAYTRIDWAWLVLPCALLGLEILMVLHMVLRSVGRWREEAVWKSDPLPLLFYKARFAGPRGELPDVEGPMALSQAAVFDQLSTVAEAGPSNNGRLHTSAELGAVAQDVKVRFRKGTGRVQSAFVERQQLLASKHNGRVTVIERGNSAKSGSSGSQW